MGEVRFGCVVGGAARTGTGGVARSGDVVGGAARIGMLEAFGAGGVVGRAAAVVGGACPVRGVGRCGVPLDPPAPASVEVKEGCSCAINSELPAIAFSGNGGVGPSGMLLGNLCTEAACTS